MAARAGRHR